MYTNATGESFSISTFKYYISNIQLFAKGGKVTRVPGYFLVNANDTETHQIELQKKNAGNYDTIQFILGVDSARNCAGAQDGDLDPLNGMFWTWKSGYIFLKLEGHAPMSSLRAQKIEYHIGGYRPPANCIRTIKLALAPGTTSVIHLQLNIDQLFPAGFSFAQVPSVTGIDHAADMADRFPLLFRVMGQAGSVRH